MRILYVLFVLSLFAACSKDNGNYDYRAVNTITIDSLLEEYTVVQFDTLTIEPYLSFAEEDVQDLSFEWSIDNNVISTDRICHAEIRVEPNAATDKGWYSGLLTVTDNATDLKYFKSFNLKVNTAYSNAVYFLSEDAEQDAHLSFQRRDIPDAPIVHDVYEAANPRLGSLGRKPQQLYTSSETFTPTFIILCEEGDKPMVELDVSTLQEVHNYNAEAVDGGYTGTFTPRKIKVSMSGMVAADEGLFGYNYMNSYSLYRPIPGDYEFAHWIDCDYTMASYMFISYDNKGEQFLNLNLTTGVSYDDVIPIEPSEDFSTAGQKFLVGGHSGYSTSYPVLYNAEEDKAYFYRIGMAYEFNMITMLPDWTFDFTKVMEKTGLLDENSVAIFGENSLYWYIANGNKIVRLHGNGGEPMDLFTVPEGEVTAVMLDDTEGRLFVASFDGTQSHIYVVSVLTENFGELTEDPMQMENKIVSMAYLGEFAY